MTTVDVRSPAGDVVGQATLPAALFEAQVNVPVMHQVVVAQMAARRSGTADTKRRGEVSGGGKKPWRQKGTGRARQGSTRAPHWLGGGVVFGPHPRSYEMKVPKKMRALALRSALSDRARENKVLVLEGLGFDKPRTKDAVAVLDRAGLDGFVLIVTDGNDENVTRSFRNIERVHLLSVDQLNVYDILARDWLVLTREALGKLEERAAAVPATKDKATKDKATVGETV